MCACFIKIFKYWHTRNNEIWKKQAWLQCSFNTIMFLQRKWKQITSIALSGVFSLRTIAFDTPAIVSNHMYIPSTPITSSITSKSLWNRSPYSSLTAPRFSGKLAKSQCRECRESSIKHVRSEGGGVIQLKSRLLVWGGREGRFRSKRTYAICFFFFGCSLQNTNKTNGLCR